MTRAVLGGHLDIASSLNSIDFSSGGGEMRSAIAHIRKWSRGNTAQVSSSSLVGDIGAITNSWKDTETDLQKLFSTEFNPQAFTPSLDFSSEARLAEARKFTPVIVSTEQFFSTSPNAQQPIDYSSSLGTLKSANPQSFFRRFFTTRAQRLAKPVPYSGVAGTTRGTEVGGGVGQVSLSQFPIDILTDGIWQFLFNPSELELAAGPEYRNAEVWAVSGNENSGQPLHWSHNKNPTLKFSSVILNGYVFGRQVEELEQGLLALFMARDGLAQDGPMILEFVWGKKAFGPCVIRDIVIKEKAWDAGLLVNAEVSFTLERIPEWTINDGFVDVARPGAQPVLNDPLLNSGSGVGAGTGTNPNNTTGSTPTAPQPSTPAAPAPRPASATSRGPCASYGVTNCRQVAQIRRNLLQLNSNIQATIRSPAPRPSNPLFFDSAPDIQIIQARFNSHAKQYQSLFNRAKGLFGNCFTSRITEANSPVFLNQTLNSRTLDFEQKYSALSIAVEDSAIALFKLHGLSKCASDPKNVRL